MRTFISTMLFADNFVPFRTQDYLTDAKALKKKFIEMPQASQAWTDAGKLSAIFCFAAMQVGMRKVRSVMGRPMQVAWVRQQLCGEELLKT